MTMRGILGVLLGVVIVTTGATQAQVATPGSDGSGSLPLEDLLQSLGRQYDAYFTIEGGWRDGEAVNGFATASVKIPAEGIGIRPALDQMAKDTSNLRFEVTRTTQTIVHIIDKRLDGQSRYAPGITIPSIELNGTIADLIADLRKREIPIALQTVFAIGRPIAIDRDTRVSVKASALPVRRILSDFIPLKGYSRVIWTAATKLGAGAETAVAFKGAKS